MKLFQILDKLSDHIKCGQIEIRYFGMTPHDTLKLEIKDITDTSWESYESSVFVALRGARFDGNDFIPEAVRRGTRVFLTEVENPKIDIGIVIISKNIRKTMAEIVKNVYCIPAGAMIYVGIGGTKGKTTVCELCASSLRSFGIKTVSVGTIGAYFNQKAETQNTTPTLPTLYRLLYSAYKKGARVAVIEVSSQALKVGRVFGITFDIVAFTSFGVDHIGVGEHKNICDYIASKRTLFTSYGAKICVLNYDDPYSSYFTSGIPRLVRCGLCRGADYRIKNFKSDLFTSSFTLCGNMGHFHLPGEFNATNIAISAAIVKYISKRPLCEILDVMSDIKIPGRFECYRVLSRHAIIDYAHNEKSLYELLSFVRKNTVGKIISVFGSVGERSILRRRSLGEAAERLSDFSVLTSDNPGYENAYEIAEEIYTAFHDKSRAKIIEDREAAIRYAFRISSPGDTILLLGKGHEEYMLKEGRKIKFSEKDIISDIIENGIK